MLRRRFADVIARQLDLFAEDHAHLIRRCEEAELAYDRADRDDAEELYGDYVDLVDTGSEALAELRESYASSLDEDDAREYEAAFNRAVLKRFKRFALDIEDA
jgi:hypothetical protein